MVSDIVDSCFPMDCLVLVFDGEICGGLQGSILTNHGYLSVLL